MVSIIRDGGEDLVMELGLVELEVVIEVLIVENKVQLAGKSRWFI